jgi:vacuolar-type H+-ATPase subunit H
MESLAKLEDQSTLTPAEKYYKNHLEHVKKYQQKNPKKMREKCKKYLEKMKIETPEKYQDHLEQKRQYYKCVTKPRIIMQKLLQPI